MDRSHKGELQCTGIITLACLIFELVPFVVFHTWVLFGACPSFTTWGKTGVSCDNLPLLFKLEFSIKLRTCSRAIWDSLVSSCSRFICEKWGCWEIPCYFILLNPSPESKKKVFFGSSLISKLSYAHSCTGIWGSAFCIQFKRLLKDDKKTNQLQALEQEREELGNCRTLFVLICSHCRQLFSANSKPHLTLHHIQQNLTLYSLDTHFIIHYSF